MHEFRSVDVMSAWGKFRQLRARRAGKAKKNRVNGFIDRPAGSPDNKHSAQHGFRYDTSSAKRGVCDCACACGRGCDARLQAPCARALGQDCTGTMAHVAEDA
jgi:hypothetical protein